MYTWWVVGINSYINITIIIYILVWFSASSIKHLVAKNVSNVNINMSRALLPNIVPVPSIINTG